MRHVFIYIALTLYSCANASSGSIIGSWSNCISNDPDSDIEHMLTFDRNGVETEVYIVKEKSASPCQGKPEFLLGTYWH